MTDLFDDDDLFAPRPAPAPPPAPPPALPPRKSRNPDAPRWITSEGKAPRLKDGARVVVELRNGETHGNAPVNNDSKLGWLAKETRWSFLPADHPCRAFDVVKYRVL